MLCCDAVHVCAVAAPQLRDDGGVGRQRVGDHTEVVVAAQQPAAGHARVEAQRVVALLAALAGRPAQLRGTAPP